MSAESTFVPRHKLLLYSGSLPELAELVGRRLVVCDHPQDRKFSAARVKALTGEDLIQGRLPQSLELEG